MDFESLFDIPIDNLHTPCYLTDARLLQKNTALLKQIQQRTGCKILLAQKAFSMFSAYPLIRDDLAGTTASGYPRLGSTGRLEFVIFQSEKMLNNVESGRT